jgi:hypothetical protein
LDAVGYYDTLVEMDLQQTINWPKQLEFLKYKRKENNMFRHRVEQTEEESLV